MTAKPRSREWMARSMMAMVLLAGLFGVAAQFLGDTRLIAVFVGMGVFGGLVAHSSTFDEGERQLLYQTYSTALQWLFFALLVACAFFEVSEWLNAASSITAFLNAHWPGLTVSMICVLLGVAGLRLFRAE